MAAMAEQDPKVEVANQVAKSSLVQAEALMDNSLVGAARLTDEVLAMYQVWLCALAQFPLDEEDVHSVCAHCRYKDLGIAQARDIIEEALQKEHLIRQDFLPPDQVGFDPRNRDELGGNWSSVHELIAVIKRVGWSDGETKGAVCAQIAPGDKEVESFNQRLVEGVPLMPVPDGSLLFSSIGCGHTNCGLRAIKAACPNSDPTISVDGKLSKELIGKTDKRFALAVDRGLHWKILHHSVRAKYPEAILVLIAASLGVYA